VFLNAEFGTRLSLERDKSSVALLVSVGVEAPCLVMDEVGRMPELKEMIEALEPIMSSNPEFV
jgi:hypothetical protein